MTQRPQPCPLTRAGVMAPACLVTCQPTHALPGCNVLPVPETLERRRVMGAETGQRKWSQGFRRDQRAVGVALILPNRVAEQTRVVQPFPKARRHQAEVLAHNEAACPRGLDRDDRQQAFEGLRDIAARAAVLWNPETAQKTQRVIDAQDAR